MKCIVKDLSITVTFIVLLFSLSYGDSQEFTVSIETPKDGAIVKHKEIVRGTVSNPSMQVYVLVHPMSTELWWVQNIPSPPNKKGSWQTLCYFGTEKPLQSPESFEVAAIVTNEKLKAGMVLKALPENARKSEIILVERKK